MKKTDDGEFLKKMFKNPKEIIAWCKKEIKEYEKLIKILENENNN